jgi:hypothetical protein
VSRLDLVALVADGDIQKMLETLLRRPADLGIGPIQAHVQPDSRHDPGCYRQPEVILRNYLRDARYALVVLDREGAGADREKGRQDMEQEIEALLSRNGWNERSAAIVIDPEVEAWVWTTAPDLAEAFGWKCERGPLRPWLKERGLWDQGPKPPDPKAAVEATLRQTGRPRSSALYARVGASAPLEDCVDPAFRKLRRTLQSWFPV